MGQVEAGRTFGPAVIGSVHPKAAVPLVGYIIISELGARMTMAQEEATGFIDGPSERRQRATMRSTVQ